MSSAVGSVHDLCGSDNDGRLVARYKLFSSADTSPPSLCLDGVVLILYPVYVGRTNNRISDLIEKISSAIIDPSRKVVEDR